jgi:ABC-type polysaccharide/polyol phosphate transport system ATPase subunit
MARALLEVDGVSKSFAIPSVRRETVREHLFGVLEPRRFERLTVLDNISFELREGETLGIMGRNGCGKSTLLKILCGIYTTDSGVVRVNAGLTPILELGVGWNPELDAIDNIFLIGAVMGLSLRAVESSLGDILAFAEVERFAHLKLKHYSSGMASRLAYAIAFHAVRDVLVLDEIFAVGDAGFTTKCQERYRELRAMGHSVVLVSHDPVTVEKFCDRALFLGEGQIVLNGSAAAIAAHYRSVVGGEQPEHGGDISGEEGPSSLIVSVSGEEQLGSTDIAQIGLAPLVADQHPPSLVMLGAPSDDGAGIVQALLADDRRLRDLRLGNIRLAEQIRQIEASVVRIQRESIALEARLRDDAEQRRTVESQAAGIDALRAECSRAWAEVAAIRASRTWRATAWVRRAYETWRRVVRLVSLE